MTLEIRDLQAKIEDKPILTGINLTIKTGEIHAIMGPNGSGKSTLSNVIMGHPAYTVTAGEVLLDGQNILDWPTDERARAGLFMAFQYPIEIPGITVGRFLKRASEIRQGHVSLVRAPLPGRAGASGISPAVATPTKSSGTFVKDLREAMDFMEIDQKFINRYLNEGFSGGEKKRMEVLQMLLLKPSFAILDETDSGLDIDALKIVSKGVNRLRQPDFGAIIITHYQRLLNHIRPDFVHILYKGRIVQSGGEDLVQTLEDKGYDWVKAQYGIQEDDHEQPSS
jgi:Fe-S cluster assembly ATP-binding protein